MKNALLGATLLIMLGLGGLFYLGKASQSGAAAGLAEGRLGACPPTPNCVSSERNAPDAQRVDPLIGSAWAQLPVAIVDIGGTVTKLDAAYIAAEFTSDTFEFVDDLEFRLTEDVVHVRSASRAGYSDQGVNRARVASLREHLGS